MFERVDTSTGSDYRHYIYAAGRPVAVVSRTTAGTTTARALFADRQGSISSIITDSTGTALVNESFTAYGNRREASTWNGAPTSTERTAMDGVTRQGYTFQTVLGSMGLNHMNGRVEDAITGRFLSPDPNVPDPGNTQSYNRYSYVNNNPLSQIDPTGFENISGARDQWARDAKYGKTLAIRQTAAFMIFSFSLTDWYAQAAGAFGLGGDGGGGGALYVTGTDSNGFAISQ